MSFIQTLPTSKLANVVYLWTWWMWRIYGYLLYWNIVNNFSKQKMLSDLITIKNKLTLKPFLRQYKAMSFLYENISIIFSNVYLKFCKKPSVNKLLAGIVFYGLFGLLGWKTNQADLKYAKMLSWTQKIIWRFVLNTNRFIIRELLFQYLIWKKYREVQLWQYWCSCRIN